jgi:hypothetical protein
MTYELGKATMNEAFEFIPIPENYSFSHQLTNVFEQNEIPDIELRNISYVLNPVEFFTKSVSVNEAVPHIIRTGTVILAAIIIFALLYALCPPFRFWVKACCFCNNPRKYWERRGYHIPTFQRINPQAICTEDVPGHPNNPANRVMDDGGRLFDNDGGDRPILRSRTDAAAPIIISPPVVREKPTPTQAIIIESPVYARPNKLTVRPLVTDSDFEQEDESPYLDMARGVPPPKPLRHFQKNRINTLMRKEMDRYKQRAAKRKQDEIDRNIEVLAKRTQCANFFNTPEDKLIDIEEEKLGRTFTPGQRDELRRHLRVSDSDEGREMVQMASMPPLPPMPPPMPLVDVRPYTERNTKSVTDNGHDQDYPHLLPLPPTPPETAHNNGPNTSDGIRRMADILSSQLTFRQMPPQ